MSSAAAHSTRARTDHIPRRQEVTKGRTRHSTRCKLRNDSSIPLSPFFPSSQIKDRLSKESRLYRSKRRSVAISDAEVRTRESISSTSVAVAIPYRYVPALVLFKYALRIAGE